jgi:hypothetical protein
VPPAGAAGGVHGGLPAPGALAGWQHDALQAQKRLGPRRLHSQAHSSTAPPCSLPPLVRRCCHTLAPPPPPPLPHTHTRTHTHTHTRAHGTGQQGGWCARAGVLKRRGQRHAGGARCVAGGAGSFSSHGRRGACARARWRSCLCFKVLAGQ